MVELSTTVSALETSSVVCGVPEAVTTTLLRTWAMPSGSVTVKSDSRPSSIWRGVAASKPGAAAESR